MSQPLDASEMALRLKELAEPFAPECISHLPKGGTTLSYVGHANITARLNAVDPLWTWQPFATDERGLPAMDYNAAGQPVGMWIYLTVLGKTLPAYGSCMPNKQEAVKELIGDALRNGAMRFGVALYLWAKDGLDGEEAPPQAAHRAPERPQQAQTRQNAQVPQTAQRAPQNGTQTQTRPRVGDGGDPVSPMNELCAYADSIGVANPVPPHMINILKQEGADFKAVTAGNLVLAKNYVKQHVEGKMPPDDDPFRGEA